MKNLNHQLIQLVHAVASGNAPPAVLLDFLTDNPVHTDLDRLRQCAAKDYRNCYENTTKRARPQDYAAIDRVLDGQADLRAMAASVLRMVCEQLLHIDHLGRPLDKVTGRLSSYMGDSLTAGIIAMQDETR